MHVWYRPYRRFENAATPQWRQRCALAANFETTDNNKRHETHDQTKMDEKRKRQCYSIKFKLEVISYTKTHGNRAAERNFDSNEKIVRYWRRQEETLRAVVGKHKKTCLRRGIVKWPKLEEELKDWVVDHRNHFLFFLSKHPCKIGVRLIQWCDYYAYKYGI